MGEFVSSVMADFTPGAAGIWTLVIMLSGMLAKWNIDNRKLSVEERQAKREGFTRQVELLTAENRALRSEMQQIRAEHSHYRQDCEGRCDEARDDAREVRSAFDKFRDMSTLENSQLRQTILTLEYEITGLKRRITTVARDLAVIARRGDPEIVNLLERLKAEDEE